MTDLTEDIMNNRSNRLVVFFIYLSVFINSYVFSHEPFEFHFGYLIFLVLLPAFITRHKLNKQLIYIFALLLLIGLMNIVLGNNTAGQFFKVFTGMVLSYFFYYYVIIEFNSNVEQLFKWYLKGAFIVSVIGVIQFISYQINYVPGYNYKWIFNKWGVILGGNFGIRINSIFGEPSHLGGVLSAAFFVALYNLFQKEGFYLSRVQSLTIVIIYLLSFSGLGQLGVFLTIIFIAINFGLVRYILLLVPFTMFLFYLLYNNVKDFRERYDSLIELFTTGKFVLGKTHGSSFILWNNYTVALENFKTNFIFGTGIGSHLIAFDKFSKAKDFVVRGFNFNSADANSMLLRLISETGLFGVTIFLVIIFKGYVKRVEEETSKHWIISNALLVMILLNLFRQGHYFLNGFPFFVLLYIFNAVDYKNQKKASGLITEVPKTQDPSSS